MTATRLVIHGARKLDASGVVDDFWLRASGVGILATGTGDGWRAGDGADATVVDAQGAWLTPGFIDLHGHGGGGYDYEHGADGIRRALAVHRARGTTRSVLSVVTGTIEHLEAALAAIADLHDPLVLGSHLEGPFLSSGHRGAHREELLLRPQWSVASRLIAAAAGTLRQMTVAPELPGAMALIERLTEEGITVAIGHTGADALVAQGAFDRGASILTHAFNGMPGLSHRAPGPVGAAIADERVTLELVLDGVHVDPLVASVLFRSAPRRVALITDAMAAAGAADGAYLLGGRPVTVDGGVARIAGGGSIAGSTLTQDAALRGALELGLDPVDAVAALTRVPAAALGLQGTLGALAPGFAADAVLLDRTFRVQRVWADGIDVGG